MNRILLLTVLVIFLFPLCVEALQQSLPDRLDVETWLLPDHRLATRIGEDDDSILFEDSLRFIDLNGDGAYEIVLLAEMPLDEPNRIPPERSYLYIYRFYGQKWDRVLLHDAGPGRFNHLAFPDFNNDGAKEILFSLSSKYALDFDRFEILRAGGYFFRPHLMRDQKIYMLSDLNSDGNLDIITTHRYKPDQYYLFSDWKLTETPFESLENHLLSKRLKLYQHLVKRQKERKKSLEK